MSKKRPKVRFPQDIAESDARVKRDITLYLTIKRIEQLTDMADKAGTSVSKLVDAAIEAYIAAIRDSKTSK